MPYLQSNSSARSGLRGVTTCLGLGVRFATACTVVGFTPDATAVEISTGISETTRGITGPSETEVLAIGASVACLLLALGATVTVGLPAIV
jgi:hypothetical protein